MSNRYFGKPWNPNISKHHKQTPTPVGEVCSWCEENIEESDQGFIIPHGRAIVDEDKDGVFDKMVATFKPIHLDCFLRQVLGSAGHQNGKCSCFGGDEEDPPGTTKREAAQAAVRLFESKQRGAI